MNNQGIIAFVDSSFIVREMLDLVLSIEKNWQTLTDWKNTKLSGSGAYYTQKLFEYMCDTYNIPYLFITRGEFGLPNFDCKDFADLHDKFTKEEINVFIKDTIKYVELRFKENKNADTEFGVYSNSLPF